jgi:DNA (cytosine-5)-methyltransferase 1
LHALAVLKQHFPSARSLGDIESVKKLPACEILAAGFPCQDLSQAGKTRGIYGKQSGLIQRAFELIESADRKPKWILIENVPFMLSLHGGKAITWLTSRLVSLGYRWAYRVIDARAFGLAQRRRRVFLLASVIGEPAKVLFSSSKKPFDGEIDPDTPHGFYWTEGNRGTGWAANAIPPLKCSSGLGIVSPPAIWLPKHQSIVIPTIEDAEALQGLPRGWTKPATALKRGDRARWKLVGNAVPAPISEWIGGRISADAPVRMPAQKMNDQTRWPLAAFGEGRKRFQVFASEWPVRRRSAVEKFLSASAPLLSARATKGFYRRLLRSGLRVPAQFVHDLASHFTRLEGHDKDGFAYKQTNVSYARKRQRTRARHKGRVA